jgi:HK97 family phage prohead protease
MFARGAFRKATRAPHHVWLSFEHKDDPLNLLGQGVELLERDDGLHGTFKVYDTPAGDQGLAMVREGGLTGLSVRAFVMSPGRREGDVVVRTNCRLDHVALCREPAYAGAVIEALRSAAPRIEPVELTDLRPPRNVQLDERIHALRERGVLPFPD